MATRAKPMKRGVNAADLQTDATVTHESKRIRHVGPDIQGNDAKCPEHKSIHPEYANQASEHYGTELSTSIHSLPPELMAAIFSRLNCQRKVRAACVCSYWRDLIDIPSVWRDVCSIIDVDKLTPEQIEMMHIRMIRKVKICNCINVEKMIAFLQGLPHLKNLVINFLPSTTRFCNGENIFPGIKHLTINCSNLNTGDLQSFLQPMVNLQELRLACIPDDNIFRALTNSMSLVSLYIRCNRGVVIIGGPSMGDLISVTSLKQLTLEKVRMGDSGLDFISRAFPQLCVLELSLADDVTSDGLAKLAKLKHLEKLTIGSAHFQHGWVEHLDTELPQLKHLSLHECRHISNECLKSVSKMPVLRQLIIQIQDQEVEGLHALSQGCSGLQSLLLKYGKPAINQGLHVMIFMRNLQELILLACSVNDDFWRENSKLFSKLRRLSFINCQLVSEQCLPYLSQMACLEKLLLKKCMAFGNESIKHLGEWWRFKALTHLQLVKLGIKDNSLLQLSRNTPFLKKLRIVSCNNLTEDGITAAVLNLLHLQEMETDIGAEIKEGLKRIQPHLKFYCI